MADEILKRDQNFVTVLAGVTDDSDQEIKMLRVDPITKRLLVQATGGGGVGSWSTPPQTPNSSTLIFTVGSSAPTDVVSDGLLRFSPDDYTFAAGQITFNSNIPPTYSVKYR